MSAASTASALHEDVRDPQAALEARVRRNERRAWLVTGVCTVTLVVQIAGGILTRSMALTASGLHMAAHVAVMLTAAGAYGLGRRLGANPRFAFGAGKLGYLAGFANAVVLAVTAVSIAGESLERLFSPEAVDYAAAYPLAAVGLVVNGICAWLIRPLPGAAHAHGHDHEQDHDDLNLAAAHLHLSADVAIAALTLAGLAAGERLGWRFADPLLGLAGAGLVAQFAWTLIRRAGATLLDAEPSAAFTAEVRRRLEADGAEALALHVWRIAPGRHAVVGTLADEDPAPVETYRARLAGLPGLSHLTLEVRRRDAPLRPGGAPR